MAHKSELHLKHYGLIGYPLTHSLSPNFFNEKFRHEHILAEYTAYPMLKIGDFVSLVKLHQFSGMNVTIPYKEEIIPYLDYLDPISEEVGAVNTISFQNDKMIGYNTDVYGFESSLLEFIGDDGSINGAWVLGTGGASKAVCYVLNKLGIEFKKVSRTGGDLNYNQLDKKSIEGIKLIINTTPLGMYPDVNLKPEIPYNYLNEKYFLYDLIYNPEKTLFLTEGSKYSCKIKNGSDMFKLQAIRSWQIWNQTEM